MMFFPVPTILNHSLYFRIALLVLLFFLFSCSKKVGENGNTTLTLKTDSEVTGQWQACVSGISKDNKFGCISNFSDNSTYELEAEKAYPHFGGTFIYSLKQNSTVLYQKEYTTVVNAGETSKDPTAGKNGDNINYVMVFKLADATISQN